MSRIHVVHVIPTLTYGGAERSVVDIVNGGDHHHVRYSIFVFKNVTPMASQIHPGAAEVRLIPKRGKLSIGLFFALRAALKNAKPDVVHTHLFGGDVWGRLAARSLGIPVITTEHNVDTDVGVIRQWVKRTLRTWSAQYVACSEAVKQFVTQVYRVPASRIQVIRYGFDTTPFRSAPQPFQAGAVRFLILGRLAPQKGIDIALKALSSLPEDIAWTLDIVGDGDLHNELREEVQVLGLGGRVQFHRATADVPRMMATHDVLLVPSRWEGLGIVAMEAMAAGRIVIASRVGGLPEFVKDGVTGYTVPSEHIPSLVEAMVRVCTHPVEAQQIGVQAQAYAKAHFDAPRMVADYEAMYRRIRV